MSDKVFVDTNVLVYAHDRRAGSKHETARLLIEALALERRGVLSMQVLQEFYSTVTRKLAAPLPRGEARAIVHDFSIWCVSTTPEDILRAFRIEDEARIGFWDAMILAAAVKSGATKLLSEDLNPGQTIAGVTVENPFVT